MPNQKEPDYENWTDLQKKCLLRLVNVSEAFSEAVLPGGDWDRSHLSIDLSKAEGIFANAEYEYYDGAWETLEQIPGTFPHEQRLQWNREEWVDPEVFEVEDPQPKPPFYDVLVFERSYLDRLPELVKDGHEGRWFVYGFNRHSYGLGDTKDACLQDFKQKYPYQLWINPKEIQAKEIEKNKDFYEWRKTTCNPSVA